MSADFWAGYLSGAVSIIIGNPLDVLKVRLQTSLPSSSSSSPQPQPQQSQSVVLRQPRNFLLGTAAPILTYGALNALLFVSYNRSEAYLNSLLSLPSRPPPGQQQQQQQQKGSNLTTTFLAGCLSGIATFLVSCPTEIVKVRSQTGGRSSWGVAREIVRGKNGIRGLYEAGGVTVVRDSVGYGFYFWGYELSSRLYNSYLSRGVAGNGEGGRNETGRALLCGGVAGVVTWASIFPLDVVKTRLQTRGQYQGERQGLLGSGEQGKRKGAWELGRDIWRREGGRVFFRGLGVCSLRAFVVNAVQFAVYEGVMAELSSGDNRNKGVGGEMEVGL